MNKLKDYPEIIKLLNRRSWTKKRFEENLKKKYFLQSETESLVNQAIEQGLLKEGICRKIIDKNISKRKDDEACSNAIEYKKKRILEKKQDKTKILYNYLISKGFSSDLAYKLLKIEQ